MKTLQQLCTPRPSVFDRSKRDVVLDLTDLMDNRIHADEFFAENYVTEGMRRLLTHAFRRFRGETEQGVYVLILLHMILIEDSSSKLLTVYFQEREITI